MRDRMLGGWVRKAIAMGVALVCAAAATPGFASGPADKPPEDRGADTPTIALADAVQQLIDAPYLNEAERAAMRVHHGVWQPGDFLTPALRAEAALIAGAWGDAVFDDQTLPADVRAQAMLRRGDAAEALALLDAGAQPASAVRAARIRAEALETLGRFADADAAAQPAVDAADEPANIADAVDAAGALALRARVRGQPAAEYHRMLSVLARAREKFDRLDYWSLIGEARLLYEKDNRKQASEAAIQALSLCPALADGWELLGRMAADGFNFEAAGEAANNLERSARTLVTDPPEGMKASAQAGVVRAICWLRQNEPRLAMEELTPSLALAPRYRDALALRAAAVALTHDLDALRLRLGEFQALSPGSPIALYAVGKALAEARQYEDAASYLSQASALQPKWPAPLIDLGLLELQSGRDDRATDALEQATALDPFNVRAANSLTLLKELATYERVESAHFIVRFKPGVDRALATEMLEPLEKIHQLVCVGPGSIGHEPARKTVIELMPDHAWFAVRITGMPDIHTVAASTGPVIAMESPKVGPGHEMGEYDWERVLRHEYVHTATLSLTKNRIPHWFTEAAAVHYEGGPVDFDTARLLTHALKTGALFDLREINVAFVLPKKPTDRAQAYAQGHHMYEYMLERFGPDTPLKLMALYAEGAREEDAFSQVLGVRGEEFLSGFTEWLRERASAWGLLPTPPMEELVRDATLATEAGRAAALRALEATADRAAGAAGGAWAPEPDAEPFEPTEVSDEVLAALAEQYPDHSGVLGLRVRLQVEQNAGEPTAEMIPLLEKYAAAMPVDPMPHKLLARLYLAQSAETEDRATPHLEYLDAREQYSPAYAAELARRHAAARRPEQAMKSAERATRIAPFNASMRELAATVALMANDLGAAERHISALTLIEPDRPVHAQRLQKVRERKAAGKN